MSWLYTVLFTGLMVASPTTEPRHTTAIAPLAANVSTTTGDETERFEQTYPLNANGRVSVSNVNGSIVIEAWDRNEVRFEYTKTADTREMLANAEVKIDAKPDHFDVDVDFSRWRKGAEGWRSGKLTIDMKLTVPRGAALNEIETVNGSVTASDFTNMTRISAVNGQIKAINLRGGIKLSTVNGSVHADLDRLDSTSKVSLGTVNGQVSLVLPSDVNATLDADSLNGTISNDFGLKVHKGKYVGRDMRGKIGTGDAHVKLDSVNGTLTITRRNDGKTQSPAVDLAPQPEFEAAVRARSIDVDLAKIAENNKQIEKMMKAEAAIKIAPAIAAVTAESIARTAEAISRTVKPAISARLADLELFSASPRIEKKSGSFVVKGVPKVTVEARGCSVAIRGWDRPEIAYRVVSFGDQRNDDPISFTEDHSDTAVNLKVDGRADRGSGRVRLELQVPQKSNMSITADGELRIEGVTGEISLVGAEGPINVRDTEGRLKVTSADGLVRVIGFRGELDARTVDGTLNLEGDFKALKAAGAGANISVTIPEGSSAEIDSNCDAVGGEGLALRKVETVRERTKYRVGGGGPLFTIDTEGQITIRSASAIAEK